MANGISDARLFRPSRFRGDLELTAAPRRRSPRRYAPRYSTSLGLCVRWGRPTTPTLNGTTRFVPASALTVLSPGDVWSSTSTNAYWSLDVGGRLLERALAARSGSSGGVGFQHVIDDAEIRAQFLRLFRGLVHQGAGAFGEERLVSFIAGLPASRVSAPRNPVEVDRVRSRLVADPVLGLPLGQLSAEEAPGWTRFRLTRRFRDAFGVPPSRFLGEVRVDEARRLMRSGFPLSSIPASVGFYDQSHMSRWFRRTVGVTPSAYAQASSQAFSAMIDQWPGETE